ncbi:MAG TPA: ABC transporter substrate-binding protein, partial [Polyangia bacterium]
MLLSLVCVACTRRHSARRGTAKLQPDAGETHASHHPVLPAGLKLPEIAPNPTKPEPYGGTLRVHLESEPPHLNPLQDQLQVIQRVVGGLVYETLIECRENQYRPGLAESWEVSADGERILLKLRSGVRWHDDRAFSGVDVQATFEPLLRSSNQSILHTMLEDVEGVDVLPDRGARFRLRRPSDLVLRALCEVPILPAETLRKSGSATQLGRQPVGTGPFKFSSWERGKRIKLARSRPAEKTQSRPPFLDEIVFEIESDGSRALVRTRRGEIDILPRVLEVLYPDQVSPATLRNNLDLWWLTPDRTSFIVPNHRRGPLADARFRRALSLLWDRARFSDEIHHGLTHPVGAPAFAEVAADPLDRTQAISLLETAGFRDTDGDGVRDIGGVPIRLTFLLPAGARSLAAEVKGFALDMRRAGLLLDTATVDAASLQARLDRGDFDLAILMWEGRPDEDPRPLYGTQGQLAFSGF